MRRTKNILIRADRSFSLFFCGREGGEESTPGAGCGIRRSRARAYCYLPLERCGTQRGARTGRQGDSDPFTGAVLYPGAGSTAGVDHRLDIQGEGLLLRETADNHCDGEFCRRADSIDSAVGAAPTPRGGGPVRFEKRPEHGRAGGRSARKTGGRTERTLRGLCGAVWGELLSRSAAGRSGRRCSRCGWS